MKVAVLSVALATTFLVSATTASAQGGELRNLSPNVSVLFGDNGNLILLADKSGVLLVDSELPKGAPQILAAARSVSPGPIRFVINTHWHVDHTGSNRALAEAGAVVIAHRNVRVRRAVEQYMPAYKARIPAESPTGLPIVTVGDAAEVHFAGDTVVLRHAPAAHTDGDLIIRLEKANLLHLGDLYFNGMFPFIDVSSGGGVRGVIAAIDMALSMADDRTKILPSHGPMSDKRGLAAYADMLRTVTAAVERRIAAGDTVEQVRAAKLAAAYADRYEGDADAFVTFVYDSLKQPTASRA
jgi:cyclase